MRAASRLGGAPNWRRYSRLNWDGLRTTDPSTEIPPAALIPARVPRATPYLYAGHEVTALVTAAGSLRSPLRAAYRTLIGLLAVTGMRVGEAIGLDRGDADLEAGTLTIRSGKNGKGTPAR